MFLGEVAHEELLDLQSTGVPPRESNEKCISTSASREAGRFSIQKEPLFRIFERGASSAGKPFIARTRKQFKGDGGRFGELRC